MVSDIIISTKIIGRRKKLLEDWAVSYPPEWNDKGDSFTLRDLITRIVIENVKAFKKRQTNNRFLHALSERQIQEAVEKGKIDMGGRNLKQAVDTDEAIGVALVAFEDGLYIVIIDSQEYKNLDQQVFIKPGSQIVFIRLVMLAGG